MMLSENIRMAFSSMAGNKLRTFLSLLGIMIGVASVVAILNLGRSVSESISESFEIGGLDTVNVMPRGTARETMIFTEEFAYDLMDEIEVKVFQSQLVQAGLEGFLCSLIACVLDPELGRDEEILPVPAALPDGTAYHDLPILAWDAALIQEREYSALRGAEHP